MTDLEHVLCPVDFSEFSRHALHQAAAFARWYGAQLTVLHVYVNRPITELPTLELMPGDRARLRAQLEEFTREVTVAAPDLRVVEAYSVQEGVLSQIEALGVDFLVMGTHGRSGLSRMVLGSSTEQLLRKAPCLTLVVPPAGPDVNPDAPVRFKRILCPVEFSEASLRAAASAIGLAEDADATITLLHVVEFPPGILSEPGVEGVDLGRFRTATEASARRRLEALIPDEARGYCSVSVVVVEGKAYREILRLAEEKASDLIVMGVRGRNAADVLLFGSTTHRVVRAATCPVLVARDA